MSEMSNSIKETIDRLWERGRNSGMSDSEIIDMIEAAMRERVRTQGRTPRKKYNYTPMTDEEIRASQEKINATPEMKRPERPQQVLYGPPPREEVREVFVEERQVLYGPPPREEVREVFVKEPQVLYGPPPREEVEEIIVEPQVLYGPPPKYEVYEMFEDEPQSTDGNNPKVK